MKRASRWFVMLSVALAWASTSTPALACAMCFGKSDSNLAKGMNMGIFALLGVIITVLGGVAGFFIYLARRAAKAHPARQLAGEFTEETNSITQHV